MSAMDDLNAVASRIVDERVGPDIVDVQSPVPSDSSYSPSQTDLDAATETVIILEQTLLVANATIEALMVDRVELFAAYNAAYAEASRDESPMASLDVVDGLMTDIVDYLDGVYRDWTGHRDVVQALLSVWTAARAKIEHDIAWQAYVAARYGDTNIERASSRPCIDFKRAKTLRTTAPCEVRTAGANDMN